jgi:hypothetical protein
MHWDDAERVARRSRCSARTITSSWELTSVEISKGSHEPNAELALPNPYVSNINSAGNDDRILRITYLNTSKPSAGSHSLDGFLVGIASRVRVRVKAFAMSDGTEARQTELMNLAELI